VTKAEWLVVKAILYNYSIGETRHKILWFTEFAAHREENKANLPLPLDVKKLKSFQLQRASPPGPLTRGSVPGPHWGLCPQTPVIGLRSPW